MSCILTIAARSLILNPQTGTTTSQNLPNNSLNIFLQTATPPRSAGSGHQEVNRMPDDLYNKYEIGRVIGDGNFAIVKECTNR